MRHAAALQWVLAVAMVAGEAGAQEPTAPAPAAAPAADPATPAPAPAPAAPEATPAKKPAPKKAAKKSAKAPPKAPAGKGLVFTDALNAKLDAAYRAELTHTDNGLEATEGYEPLSTTEIHLADFFLTFSGEVRKDVDFSIVLELATPEDPVDQALVTWWMTPDLAFGFGKSYVSEGGFEEKNLTQESLVVSPYVSYLLPLRRTSAVFELLYKVAGTATFQVVEDLPPGPPDDPDQPLQPAFTLEWAGELGAVLPLVQAGVYGHGNSKYLSLGVGYLTPALHAYFDYIMDFRNERYEAGTVVKRLDTIYNTIGLEIGYDGLTSVKPYFKFTAFAAQQPDDTALKVEDRSYNTQVEELDDNATLLHFGVRMPVEEGAFTPFVAMTLLAASFQDPTDADALEDRSSTTIHMGVSGAM